LISEELFLEKYDKSQYDAPLVSVDSVLFTYHQGELMVLLAKRDAHPEIGKWGLPGGFVDLIKDRNLNETAQRKIQEKTGVSPPYLEQLSTIGDATRDRRGWSMTVCYTALIPHQHCEPHIKSVSDASWFTLEKLEKQTLAFDHRALISMARERLKQKALYSAVPAFALPEKFTLPEMQHIHEVLIGKSLQKKSFRRRIEQADLLIDTGEKRSERGRPAVLYKIKPGSESFTFIRNLEE